MTIPLKPVLMLDAASCLGLGLLLSAFSGPIAGLTALPAPLLLWAGLLLLPVAALIGWAATRPVPPAPLLALIVAGNAGWIAASLLVLALVPANGLGVALVLGQALAVAVLTLAEAAYLSRRRAAA